MQFIMNEPPNLQQPPNSSPLQPDGIMESIKQSPGHNVVPDQQAPPEHNNIDYNMVPYQENVCDKLLDFSRKIQGKFSC